MSVGKNVLEHLTTGMYSDSKIIYREYIQNACDQIDLAIKTKLFNQMHDGLIEIFIDQEKRYISIKDNATGVKKCDFIRNLGDIANSNKNIEDNKGFRGIGRLCGLGYCKILKFSTTFQGEDTLSEMICDARKMSEMINEKKQYSVEQVWDTVISFQQDKKASRDDHYFEVELIDINDVNTELLDVKKVKEYLSFVAPVPYVNKFYLRKEIYDYANKINYHIDEYRIQVNGADIFKNYTTKLKEQNENNQKNYDDIVKLQFENFYDGNNNLIAWMWIGISKFIKQIPKNNQMRGLRLRSKNIQIGDDNVLSNFFKEARGNYYFVGEVFAVNNQLIPNARRDYFNENEVRKEFEDKIKVYFYEELHKLYREANIIKNCFEDQKDYINSIEEYKQKDAQNNFIDEEDRNRIQLKIESAKNKADKAKKRLEKFSSELNASSPLANVYKEYEKKYDRQNLEKKVEESSIIEGSAGSKKKSYITSQMSSLSRKERKIVQRILSIITDFAPKEVAEQLIAKIKEEMR